MGLFARSELKVKKFLPVLLSLFLLLSACEMFAEPTPTLPPPISVVHTHTNTPSPTATFTPTPTVTLTPTIAPPTSTPTMTWRQRAEKNLYEASLRYLAYTPEDADKVAQYIDFASDPHESASSACGPLTVAIMRDGGYLPADVPVHDMWLLCPGDAPERPHCAGIGDRKLRRSYFPDEHYEYTRVKESIGTYDWVNNPLEVGDWLFLYVLTGVSNYRGFDHMLVVTRIDENGAAYSVNNINHGDGFVIQEEMLYDPTRPGVGLFYDLTNDSFRKELGMTGTDGFMLIRPKEGYYPYMQNP